MRKKLIILLLACTFPLQLVACGGNSNNETTQNQSVETEKLSRKQFSLKDINTIEGKVEYKFLGADAQKKIEPSSPKDYFTFYEAKTQGNVYLATTFEVKNIGDTANKSDEFFDVMYMINGKEYKAFEVIEEADGGDFEYANITNIEPLETRKVLFLAEIPESEINSQITINIDSDGKKLSNEFTVEGVKPKKESIAIGKVLTEEDYAEVEIDSLEYTDRVDPSKPESYYRYYEIKDPKNIYLCLGVTVKNLKSSDLDAEHVLHVRGTYNDKYKYDSFGVVEESNGGDFRYGNMNPLETAKAYYLIELPKEAQEGKVVVDINFNGQKYTIEK